MQNRESEITLAVRSAAPRSVMARLEALARVGDGALRRLPELDLHDLYFDTPERNLSAVGLSLRLRRSGGAWLVCLKGRSRRRGLAVQRLEIEGAAGEPQVWASIAAAAGAAWPRSLRTARGPDERPRDPAAILVAAGLPCIQERTTRRRRREILDRAGERLGELCIDSVAYRVEGATLHHHEVELEAAVDHDSALLEPLAWELLEDFDTELQPWAHSKLATGFALEALVRERGAAALAADAGDLLPDTYALLAQLLAPGGER